MGKTKRRTPSFGGCWKIRYVCKTKAQLIADKQNLERKRLGKLAHEMTCWTAYRCESCGQFHIGRKQSNIFFTRTGGWRRKRRNSAAHLA